VESRAESVGDGPFSSVENADVEVAILGPVEVRGAAGPFHRSAALELVVYLAFHRGGVRHAEWALAIWPDRPVALPTVHSTSSDARRALGQASDGTPHLPRGCDLRLGDSVTTDVERFTSLSASDHPDRLFEAMQLVRGPLFAGLHRADWAVFDGTQSSLESLVVRTALRGADACMGRGLGNQAAWMVRQALRVSPYDERLYRALLRATAAQGNRVGLRSTMAELLILAGEAGGGHAESSQVGRSDSVRLDCLHPETTALYRGLLDWSPVAEGRPARL
jgi:DNA-binding SARP family transcriptional activator